MKRCMQLEIKLAMDKKLKDLRTELGLATKDVSKLTGISEAIYNELENNADRDTGFSSSKIIRRIGNRCFQKSNA